VLLGLVALVVIFPFFHDEPIICAFSAAGPGGVKIRAVRQRGRCKTDEIRDADPRRRYFRQSGISVIRRAED
jgi:hypothetical protein